MRTSLFYYFLILITFISSCSSERKEIADSNVAEPMMEGRMEENKMSAAKVSPEADEQANPNSPHATEDSKSTSITKKIIKDGNISLQTKDINEGKKNIDVLLKNFSAYYETEDLQNNDQLISYNLRVRVPADNFEKLISALENGKDQIKSKNIQARDVTEEFVDIESRLKNKREYLKKYMSLLSRASTIKDILAIEENIRIIQEEIESREGRLKYLTDQVSLSTLNINLYFEKEFVYQPEQEDNFLERVKKALSNGWKSITEFLLWVVSVWPFVMIGVLIWFIFKRFRNKKNQ